MIRTLKPRLAGLFSSRLARLWIGIALVILASVQLAGSRTPDFAQDYAAAWAFWQGEPIHSSTGELLAECWPDHEFEPATIQAIQQPHPPFATLLTLPFALVPFPAARLAWCVFSGAAIIAAWQLANVKPLTCLATAPIWCVALVLGTHEPLLFVLIAAAIVFLQRSPTLAGAALGLAVATKVYPAVLLLGLLFTRHWRCLGAACVAAVLSAGAAESLFGWGTTAEWLMYCGRNTAAYVNSTQNYSLVRLVHESLGDAASPSLIAACLLALLCWPLARRLPVDDPLRPMVPVMLLTSPISWRHYMGLAGVLPLGILEQILLAIGGTLTMLFGMRLIAAPPELLVQIPLVTVLVIQLVRFILTTPRRAKDEGPSEVSQNLANPRTCGLTG